MNFNSEEKLIKAMLEQVETPKIENLYDKIHQRRQSDTSYYPRRSFKLTLVACLCCYLLFTMAFDNFYFKKLVELIGYEVYSLIQPIQLVDESDGIRLEVLGAMNDDEESIVYLTLQDLTGEIFDETLDIYNYTLSRGSAFYMQKIDYDEDTHTATFRLQGNGEKKLNGKTVHFGIQSFLTQKVKFNEINLLHNQDIFTTHEAQTVTIEDGISRGWSGYYDQENAKMLKPRELDLEIPGLDFVRLSNIGFIDNQLHVQIEWREDNIDDHGALYLTDLSNHQRIDSSENISFGYDNENLVYGRNIDEYVFNITPEDLQNYELKGDFVYNGMFTQGHWQVNFKLESTTEEMKQDVSLQVGDTLITELAVSPLGVTLRGTGHEEKLPQVQVILDNGEIITSDSSVSALVDDTVDNSEFVTKMLFPGLLDLSEIKFIQINNETILLDKEEIK